MSVMTPHGALESFAQSEVIGNGHACMHLEHVG